MANRLQQIRKIQERAMELSDELDNLVGELQDAYTNLPESLQDSSKGEAMQERIDKLTEWRDQLSDMAEEDEI